MAANLEGCRRCTKGRARAYPSRVHERPYEVLGKGRLPRALNASLHEVRELVRSGELDSERLVAAARNRVEKEPLAEIDYIEIRDAETLESLTRLDHRAVMGLAVRVAGTRLIDNTILEAV